jgi:hypothetical protein
VIPDFANSRRSQAESIEENLRISIGRLRNRMGDIETFPNEPLDFNNLPELIGVERSDRDTRGVSPVRVERLSTKGNFP